MTQTHTVPCYFCGTAVREDRVYHRYIKTGHILAFFPLTSSVAVCSKCVDDVDRGKEDGKGTRRLNLAIIVMVIVGVGALYVLKQFLP